MEGLEELFTDDFMPHGQCLFWTPSVLWLNVVSDAIIALAYYSIPVCLFLFVRRRRDVAFGSIFVLFGLFILACGTTHVMAIITMWRGAYGVEGLVKAATAGVSMLTAIVTWPSLRKALTLPSPRQLALTNEQLSSEIRERLRAEEEARRASEQLEQRVAERTAELVRSKEELEQFAYIASHDLQEPLRIVSAYSQLLEEEYGDRLDEQAREYIATSVSGARRMQRLIEDLLAYSRIRPDADVTLTTSAENALQSALANLELAVTESGARITREALPDVVTDGRLLGQLFQNLLANAMKYCGDAPPRIHVDATTEDGHVHFRVRDEGVGIAPEFHERVFEPFRRLHSDDSGTGIGLAICRRIVESSGGRIWLESAPGSGSTFHFTLPARSWS